MKLTSVSVDPTGESYFSEVESSANSQAAKGARVIDIAHWQIWMTQPGHSADFKPVDQPQCLALMSGKLVISVSTGERRFFARGDLVLLQDLAGKGHALHTIGFEPCVVMLLTMKHLMSASA